MRIEDPVRVRGRRAALDLLALAHNHVTTLRDKCAELQSLTQSSVAGHPVGDQIIARAANSVDSLGRAGSRLDDAADAAHNIDVTIEVPDPEESDG